DDDFGVTIFNNNRYGFNATAKGIYITLTRTAKHPPAKFHSAHLLIPPKQRPRFMDLKPFTFDLGVMPHGGSWKDNQIVQMGYNFNFPLVVPAALDSEERIPRGDETTFYPAPLAENLQTPFAEVDNADILLTCIKPSEWCGPDAGELLSDQKWSWNGSFILRTVEQYGRATSASIHFHPALGVKRVEEVDLLEMQRIGEFWISDNSIQVEYAPFEIKTLRVWLEPK
ncbi:MAG TPA: glycosyl hydrolase-related protein, partial [Candidatus Lokiarchaeia archaeon]|nr:glycosyl hydrolase-related protein [Candidatus Lokiarchaeia archaeon]